jgi:phytoene synthase
LLPALADTLRQYRVPLVYLHDVIDGVLMDLDERVYETFGQLCEYCRRVASAVGLACIHIWGFSGDQAALEAADCSGIAFQMTNILRDLKEDAALGRVYLPSDDLRRFNYTADDIRAGVRDDRFRQLMRFEIKRTEDFYHRGAELRTYLHADGRAAFGAMTTIYHGLLEEIVRRDCDVYTTRIRLTPWRKLRIAAHWIAIGYLPFARQRS